MKLSAQNIHGSHEQHSDFLTYGHTTYKKMFTHALSTRTMTTSILPSLPRCWYKRPNVFLRLPQVRARTLTLQTAWPLAATLVQKDIDFDDLGIVEANLALRRCTLAQVPSWETDLSWFK